MKNLIVAVNSGSSSLKLGVYSFEDGERRVADGTIERIGTPDGPPNHATALEGGFRLLGDKFNSVAAVGHRIVHGGSRRSQPAIIDRAVLDDLKAAVPLAPLHLPAGIAAIEAVVARYPGLPQVACFDTAFHASMPERARRFPLPDRFDDQGIRKYGFHGLSYEYVVSTLRPNIPKRLIIAHLGNGASLAAVENGKSIDTSMGMTPTGGVIMGTRTGDLDPGVLLHLAQALKMTPAEIEKVVDHESGLLGIGGASDMKTVLGRNDPAARLAVEMFAYSVRKTIGAYAAALGGLDMLVFTGGIGEHAAPVRADICRGLDFLGITLDEGRNAASADTISSGRCIVRVIPTDEDLVIARTTRALIS